MFLSCLQPDQKCFSCIPDKKVTVGCAGGILAIALGIILAAVFWPRGNFQILMTNEGKAVLGLVLGGFVLSTVFGAILICSRNRKRDDHSKWSVPHMRGTASEFKDAFLDKKETLLTAKNITKLHVSNNFIVSVIESPSETEGQSIVELYKFDRSSACPSAKKLKTRVKGALCTSILGLENQLIIASKERDSANYNLMIQNLREKHPRDRVFDVEITALHAEESITIKKTKESSILFIGHSNGTIDYLYLPHLTVKGSHVPTTEEKPGCPIRSIITAKDITSLNGKPYDSLLIYGTDKKIFFKDLDTEAEIITSVNAVGTNIALTNGFTLVSIDNNNALVWNLASLSSGHKLVELTQKALQISCLFCNSELAISGSSDGQILFWDLKTEESTKDFFLEGEHIQTVQLHYTTLFVSTKERALQLDLGLKKRVD